MRAAAPQRPPLEMFLSSDSCARSSANKSTGDCGVLLAVLLATMRIVTPSSAPYLHLRQRYRRTSSGVSGKKSLVSTAHLVPSWGNCRKRRLVSANKW